MPLVVNEFDRNGTKFGIGAVTVTCERVEHTHATHPPHGIPVERDITEPRPAIRRSDVPFGYRTLYLSWLRHCGVPTVTVVHDHCSHYRPPESPAAPPYARRVAPGNRSQLVLDNVAAEVALRLTRHTGTHGAVCERILRRLLLLRLVAQRILRAADLVDTRNDVAQQL
ncbi:hypothetical protein GCM10023319_09080 [Nocardia iowensis]